MASRCLKWTEGEKRGGGVDIRKEAASYGAKNVFRFLSTSWQDLLIHLQKNELFEAVKTTTEILTSESSAQI